MTSAWPAVISGELVGGEGPDRARRHGDHDPLGVALVHVLQQAAVGLGVAAGPPGGGALDAAHRASARGDEQRVEGTVTAVAQAHLARRIVDRDRRIDDQLGAGVIGELRQRHAVRMAEPKRLGHRKRTVGEVRVRCRERDAHAVARDGAQPEQPLQPGHPAADDQDIHWGDGTPPARGTTEDGWGEPGVSCAVVRWPLGACPPTMVSDTRTQGLERHGHPHAGFRTARLRVSRRAR